MLYTYSTQRCKVGNLFLEKNRIFLQLCGRILSFYSRIELRLTIDVFLNLAMIISTVYRQYLKSFFQFIEVLHGHLHRTSFFASFIEPHKI